MNEIKVKGGVNVYFRFVDYGDCYKSMSNKYFLLKYKGLR